MLKKDPMYKSIQKYSDGGDLTERQVKELLKETLEEIEEKWEVSKFSLVPRQENQREQIEEMEKSDLLGSRSVIRGPEMSLTEEERKCLDNLVSHQVRASKVCMPKR